MSYDGFIESTGHIATPIAQVEGDWIEGEPEVTDVPLTPFECALFLPMGTKEETPRGRRTVRVPTLLIAADDLVGDVTDYLRAEDMVDVVAPELTGPDPVRWQINAVPQPFGRPGDDVIGRQVTLKAVSD